MTRLIDCFDERRRAAVHNRYFGPVDFNHDIVDAKTIERGEHVLGRRYGRTVAIAKHGGKFRRSHRTEVCDKFAIFLAIDSGAPKHDAGIGLGRMKRNGYGRTGMDADPGNGHLLAQGRLPAGLHAPRHALVPELGPRTAFSQSRPSSQSGRTARFASREQMSAISPTPKPCPDTAPLVQPRTYRRTPFRANTRFLTECYLGPAPFHAESGHMCVQTPLVGFACGEQSGSGKWPDV